jgi:hypothetical protein
MKHFFIPLGRTLNDEVSWDASDSLGTAVAFTSKTARSKLLTPDLRSGAVVGRYHFASKALKEATQGLLASADDTRCTVDITMASADEPTTVKHILAKTP